MKPQIKYFLQNKTKVVIFLVALFCLGLTYWAVSKETGRNRIASSTQSACDMTASERPADSAAQMGEMLYVCPMMCVPPMAKAGDSRLRQIPPRYAYNRGSTVGVIRLRRSFVEKTTCTRIRVSV